MADTAGSSSGRKAPTAGIDVIRMIVRALLVAAALLGVTNTAAGTEAAPEPAAAHFTFDAPAYDEPTNYTAPERSPPTHAAPVQRAVDCRLHGNLVRPSAIETDSSYTNSDHVGLVQVTRARATTERQAQATDGSSLGIDGAGVAANTARSAITGSRVVSGRFPRTAGADDILVRRGSNGGVTNFQVYGPDGLPLKRVDVTGRSHGGVDTPHVVEFRRHVNPTTGEIFVRPGSTVRPATPEELMGLD